MSLKCNDIVLIRQSGRLFVPKRGSEAKVINTMGDLDTRENSKSFYENGFLKTFLVCACFNVEAYLLFGAGFVVQ